MSYLICFECNLYYEVESLEDAADLELTHCECGRELVYFENLEDSYRHTDISDGPVTEVDYAYEEEALEPVRESMANDSTYTEKKASQYKSKHEKGNFFIYAGIAIFIIGLGTGLFFNYLLFALVFIGGSLAIYGNSIIEESRQKGYSWEKGLEGENLVSNYLNTLPKDFFVFNDVNLPGKGGNIDHIVVGPTGIYVIETKNYSGRYRIKGNQWLYYKHGQYIEIKNNPGIQVRRNTLNLIDFLNQRGISTKKTWITSLVAFNCPDFRVLQTPQTYKVLLPKTVPDYILNGKKEQNIDLLRKVALELEPFCVELTFAR
ncbi:MAG: NERD domain-containing protein [Methanobacteriaceae archaeon]|nr:NERD domain-containing protein [Methanobacteriaceae archaeon]